MKKINSTISVFAFIFLFASFLLAPVNIVMADDAASGKTSEKAASDTDKDADKKKKEKGKGKKGDEEEEPECE